MKKIRVFTLAILLFFLSTNVYAVCDVTESNTLNSLATNLGISYEVVQVEASPEDDFNAPDGIDADEDYVAYQEFFRFYISNVTEELYIVVHNDKTNESKTYTYNDVVDGVITFDEKVSTSLVNYTIEVYSSDQTNCPDTLLYTWYETTPMRNLYSNYSLCIGIEEFYLCHDYLSVETSFADFERLTREYRAGLIDDDGEEITTPVEEDDNGFLSFINDHLVVVIIVAVVIVAAGGLITFVVIKKQRSRIV